MSQIPTAQNLMLYDICNQILEIDKCTRFAGFVNNMGTIIASQHRDELETKKEHPLLTKNEFSAIEAVLRMVTRQDMMPKLGKPIYSFTLYEKVKRATILLENSNDSDCPPILIVSFDNNSCCRGRNLSRIHNFEWHLAIGVIWSISDRFEDIKYTPPHHYDDGYRT